jgi:hypothetical protein
VHLIDEHNNQHWLIFSQFSGWSASGWPHIVGHALLSLSLECMWWTYRACARVKKATIKGELLNGQVLGRDATVIHTTANSVVIIRLKTNSVTPSPPRIVLICILVNQVAVIVSYLVITLFDSTIYIHIQSSYCPFTGILAVQTNCELKLWEKNLKYMSSKI